jgi:hypothetical protein
VPAQGVDLVDGRARAQERPRDRLLVGQRHARDRRDPVGRAAAGQEDHDPVARSGPGGDLETFCGTLDAGGIGNGMPGLDQRDVACRPGIAVAGHAQAGQTVGRQAVLVEIDPFRHFRHRAGGLAGGQQEDAAVDLRRRQMRGQGVFRPGGGDRGVEKACQPCAHELCVLRHPVPGSPCLIDSRDGAQP